MANLEEMDKILERYIPPRPNWEDIENMNKPITHWNSNCDLKKKKKRKKKNKKKT